MKLIVWLSHEVGIPHERLAGPGATPKRVMSCELIVVGSPWVELGMSLMIVFSPKSALS